jgi:hypothetical protein
MSSSTGDDGHPMTTVIANGYKTERIYIGILTAIMTLVSLSQVIGVGVSRDWPICRPCSRHAHRRLHSSVHSKGSSGNTGNNTGGNVQSPQGAKQRPFPPNAQHRTTNDTSSVVGTVAPVRVGMLMWAALANVFVIIMAIDPQSVFGLISPIFMQWCFRNMNSSFAHVYRVLQWSHLSILYRDMARPIPKWFQNLLRGLCAFVHISASVFPFIAWLTNDQLWLGICVAIWSGLCAIFPATALISGLLVTRIMRNIRRITALSSPKPPVTTTTNTTTPYQLQTVAVQSVAAASAAPTAASSSSTDAQNRAAGTSSVSRGVVFAPRTSTSTTAGSLVPPPIIITSVSPHGTMMPPASPLGSTPTTGAVVPVRPSMAHAQRNLFGSALLRLWLIVLGGWIGFITSLVESIRQSRTFLSHPFDAPNLSNPAIWSFNVPFLSVCIAYSISVGYAWIPIRSWLYPTRSNSNNTTGNGGGTNNEKIARRPPNGSAAGAGAGAATGGQHSSVNSHKLTS